MKYLIIFFLSLSLLADSNVSDNSYFEYEEYRHTFTKTLHEYSENIDIYLSDNNETIEYFDDMQKTSIDFAPFLAFEDKRDPQFRFKIRASIKLPRTSKRLKLSFEDFSASDSIDDYGSRTGPNEKNNYLLGLEYYSFDKKLTSMKFGGGVKTNDGRVDPYLSLSLRKYFYFNEWRLTLSEKLKYFAHLHVDNRIQANLGYFINKNTKIRLLNSYRYRDKDKTYELTNTLQIHNLISDKKNISADFSIYSLRNTVQDFDISYYKAGFHYHHKFYKKWLYYEAAPSLMFRIENDYKPTARIFLSVGIVFGQSYYHCNKKFYNNY